MVAKDYCRYKPVSIQAYGTKWDYSDVGFELIDSNDFNTEDTTNTSEAKSMDSKKENETFSRKISTWLNMSSNNENKTNTNHFENSTCPPSRNSTPVEGIILLLSVYFNI